MTLVLTSHGNRHLGGWHRQARDDRDALHALKLHPSLAGIPLPAAVDLRPGCSEIEDQGELGSCTAHMFAGIVEFNELKRRATMRRLEAAALPSIAVSMATPHGPPGGFQFTTTVTPPIAPPAPPPTPPPAPSVFERAARLFGYFVTRQIMGTTGSDSGASIRDTVKAGALYGVANEAQYPYDPALFTNTPPPAIYADAAQHKVTSYHSIADGDLATMKAALAGGNMLGFGFDVYDYMMSDAMAVGGFLRPPAPGEKFLGGHAVGMCGYSDAMRAVLCRNSWSKGWGLQGYFWMSYDYLTVPSGNGYLASDVWLIQSAPI